MPAVWVYLHFEDDYDPSDAKINRLRKVSSAISQKLLAMELDSWPYVKLVTD